MQAAQTPAELLVDVQLAQPPDSAALLRSLQSATAFLAAAGSSLYVHADWLTFTCSAALAAVSHSLPGSCRYFPMHACLFAEKLQVISASLVVSALIQSCPLQPAAR